MKPPTDALAPQPAWFADYAADRQQSDDSVLALYRRAIRARRSIDPNAELEWLETGRDDVLAFRRGSLVNVTVFDGPPFPVPPAWGGLLLASREPSGDRFLPTGSSAWYNAHSHHQ